MSEASQRKQVQRLGARLVGALRVRDWTLNEADPDGLRYVATVSVWVHWFLFAVLLFELLHRPYYGGVKFGAYGLLFSVAVAFNVFIHYRLWTRRPFTPSWILVQCAVDLATISVAVAMSAGFSHYFFHLFYYPVLAGFAVIFTSFRLNMAWVTLTALVYLGISLTAGEGLDLVARDEKPLVARIAIMYAVVITVNLVSRFERSRWRQSVSRERDMQQERAELSRAIHDTAAQSAYMIGLGIDTARELAGDQNTELTAALETTGHLSRSAMWDLRQPINLGGIYEGRELGRALRLHAISFTNITGVPAELTQAGVEPPLPVETRSLLFSIAHNALTNAFRHSQASQVVIGLDFDDDRIRLSVSDDGIGLPDDYAQRGNGFANMSRTAQRLGGELVVETRGHLGGATVACIMPVQS